MSNRFRSDRLTAPAELGRNDVPAYNVAPTDPVPFVSTGENGAHRLREGFPWWAKEMLASLLRWRWSQRHLLVRCGCRRPAERLSQMTTIQRRGAMRNLIVEICVSEPFRSFLTHIGGNYLAAPLVHRPKD